MSDSDLPPYHDVAEQVLALHLGLDAAELHGLLCGYLSGGEAWPDRRDWLGKVTTDPESVGIEVDTSLDQLFVATSQMLESQDFDFELLLPDADLSVSERGMALLAWCSGFLGGFGLSAGENPPLSEESKDALNDLARIAGSELSYDESESDEQALEEVAEFVRVAALLIHSDCVFGPRHRRSFH